MVSVIPKIQNKCAIFYKQQNLICIIDCKNYFVIPNMLSHFNPCLLLTTNCKIVDTKSETLCAFLTIVFPSIAFPPHSSSHTIASCVSCGNRELIYWGHNKPRTKWRRARSSNSSLDQTPFALFSHCGTRNSRICASLVVGTCVLYANSRRTRAVN